MANIQDTSYGRTSPARSAPTTGRTSRPSSKRSSGSGTGRRCLCLKNLWPTPTCTWESSGALRTALLTRATLGVPQRRRRIFLVADFAGWGAGQVLFESEGLSGYSAEGFRAWQRAAGNSAVGAGAAGLCLNDQGGNCMDVSSEVAATLRRNTMGIRPVCWTPLASAPTLGGQPRHRFEPERAPRFGRAWFRRYRIGEPPHRQPHQNRR